LTGRPSARAQVTIGATGSSADFASAAPREIDRLMEINGVQSLACLLESQGLSPLQQAVFEWYWD